MEIEEMKKSGLSLLQLLLALSHIGFFFSKPLKIPQRSLPKMKFNLKWKKLAKEWVCPFPNVSVTVSTNSTT
jgi:hypothetical protein